MEGYDCVPVQRVHGELNSGLSDNPQVILPAETVTPIDITTAQRDTRGRTNNSRYNSAHRHFSFGAATESSSDLIKHLACFTSGSTKLFHISITVKNSKVESDRSVFQKMQDGYRKDMAKGKRLLRLRRVLRRVRLVKVTSNLLRR